MAAATMSADEETSGRPQKKRCLFLIAVLTAVLFALVGLVVQQLVNTHGLETVSDSTNAFASKMQIIRPLLLFIAFCFWQPFVNAISRVGLLSIAQADRLVERRNRFFLWVALFEVIVGQGRVVVGVIILTSILAYPWIEKLIGRDRRDG